MSAATSTLEKALVVEDGAIDKKNTKDSGEVTLRFTELKAEYEELNAALQSGNIRALPKLTSIYLELAEIYNANSLTIPEKEYPQNCTRVERLRYRKQQAFYCCKLAATSKLPRLDLLNFYVQSKTNPSIKYLDNPHFAEVKAQLLLAKFYFKNIGVPEEEYIERHLKTSEERRQYRKQQAFHWYKVAAVQSTEARSKLARFYINNSGIQEEEYSSRNLKSEEERQQYRKQQAFHWYKLAADQGDLEGQLWLVETYENPSDIPDEEYQKIQSAEERKKYREHQIWIWAKLATDQNSVVGQSVLLRCFEENRGIPESYYNELKLTSEAERAKHRMGQVMFWSSYIPKRHFELVKKGVYDSFHWLKRAAASDCYAFYPKVTATQLLIQIYANPNIAIPFQEYETENLQAHPSNSHNDKRLKPLNYRKDLETDREQAAYRLYQTACYGDPKARIELAKKYMKNIDMDVYHDGISAQERWEQAGFWFQLAQWVDLTASSYDQQKRNNPFAFILDCGTEDLLQVIFECRHFKITEQYFFEGYLQCALNAIKGFPSHSSLNILKSYSALAMTFGVHETQLIGKIHTDRLCIAVRAEYLKSNTYRQVMVQGEPIYELKALKEIVQAKARQMAAAIIKAYRKEIAENLLKQEILTTEIEDCLKKSEDILQGMMVSKVLEVLCAQTRQDVLSEHVNYALRIEQGQSTETKETLENDLILNTVLSYCANATISNSALGFKDCFTEQALQDELNTIHKAGLWFSQTLICQWADEQVVLTSTTQASKTPEVLDEVELGLKLLARKRALHKPETLKPEVNLDMDLRPYRFSDQGAVGSGSKPVLRQFPRFKCDHFQLPKAVLEVPPSRDSENKNQNTKTTIAAAPAKKSGV